MVQYASHLYLCRPSQILEKRTRGNSDHQAKSDGVIRITPAILAGDGLQNLYHFFSTISTLSLETKIVPLSFLYPMMPNWMNKELIQFENFSLI